MPWTAWRQAALSFSKVCRPSMVIAGTTVLANKTVEIGTTYNEYKKSKLVFQLNQDQKLKRVISLFVFPNRSEYKVVYCGDEGDWSLESNADVHEIDEERYRDSENEEQMATFIADWVDENERLQREAGFPLIKPNELDDPNDRQIAEICLGLTEKMEVACLQSYIFEQQRKYFATCERMDNATTYKEKLNEVNYLYYYTWMREFLLQQSYERMQFCHRFQAGVFLPLIPPQSIAISSEQTQATKAIKGLNETLLPVFDCLLWKEFHEMVSSDDSDVASQMNNFVKFVNVRYFKILEELIAPDEQKSNKYEGLTLFPLVVHTSCDVDSPKRASMLQIASQDILIAVEDEIRVRWKKTFREHNRD